MTTTRIAWGPVIAHAADIVRSSNSDTAAKAKVERDPRVDKSLRRQATLVLYEPDGLPPEALRDRYRDATASVRDPDAYEQSTAREAEERAELDP